MTARLLQRSGRRACGAGPALESLRVPPAPRVDIATLSPREVRDTARDPAVAAVAPVMPTSLIRPFAAEAEAGGTTWGVATADVGDPARVAPALAGLRAARTRNLEGREGDVRPAEVAGAAPGALRLTVEGRRPDITIIDDRTRLDEDLGDITDVIDANLPDRPVYVIREDPLEIESLADRYILEPIDGPNARFLMRVVGLRETAA